MSAVAWVQAAAVGAVVLASMQTAFLFTFTATLSGRKKKERKTTQALRPAWVKGAQSSSRTWVLGLRYRDGAHAPSPRLSGSTCMKP